MFNPSLTDVRMFFFNVWDKSVNGVMLEGLEKIAYSVILEHNEYHKILKNKDKYLTFHWSPEGGETNPFLHLSMHMSIVEQLSIDQPRGISDLYKQLCVKIGSEHEAQHEVMECLAEMIWQAQYTKNQPDASVYLECLRAKLI